MQAVLAITRAEMPTSSWDAHTGWDAHTEFIKTSGTETDLVLCCPKMLPGLWASLHGKQSKERSSTLHCTRLLFAN